MNKILSISTIIIKLLKIYTNCLDAKYSLDDYNEINNIIISLKQHSIDIKECCD